MVREGGPSSSHRAAGEYRIIRLRGWWHQGCDGAQCICNHDPL